MEAHVVGVDGARGARAVSVRDGELARLGLCLARDRVLLVADAAVPGALHVRDPQVRRARVEVDLELLWYSRVSGQRKARNREHRAEGRTWPPMVKGPIQSEPWSERTSF